MPKKQPTSGTAIDFLIRKFLKSKPENIRDLLREKSIAKRLITKAPEILDMDLSFKLNSLAWFMTDSGKAAINKFNYHKKLQEFVKPQKQTETQEKPFDKTGFTDYSPTPNSLLNFLN